MNAREPGESDASTSPESAPYRLQRAQPQAVATYRAPTSTSRGLDVPQEKTSRSQDLQGRPISLATTGSPANVLESLDESRRGRSIASFRRSPLNIRSRPQTAQFRRRPAIPYLRQLFLTAAPLVACDLIAMLGSIAICSLLGLQWLNPNDPSSLASIWIPPVAATWLLVNTVLQLYPGIGLGTVSDFKRQTISLTIVALVTAARIHPTSTWAGLRYSFLIVAYLLCLFLAPVLRNIARKLLANCDWWGFPTLVCGNEASAFSVFEWLRTNRRLGLRPIGVIADSTELELDGDTPWHVGSWDGARSIAESQDVYWAVVIDSGEGGKEVTHVIESHLGTIPNAFVVSELTGMPDHWNRHRLDEDLDGFLIEQHLLLPLPQLVKRSTDIAIAVIAGILLMPLFVFLAIAIKLTSRGPILYGHERVGFANSRFRALKFRTMVQNAETLIEDYLNKHPELRDEWEQTHKLKNDPRVTSLGWFMRKWSIDELPQLWNVLIGEMSAVGPRPIVPNEIEKYDIYFETFCTVLPGMTGLWQVSGRNDTSFDERIQLGMYYIHHWSPWLDLYLLARTVKTVLFTKGAY